MTVVRGESRARTAQSRTERTVKMYILIREAVPLGFALVAAHASLACYLKFRFYQMDR